MPDNPFEIPQSLREASEQNLRQAQAAYKQLMDFMNKAMDAWMEVMPENAMTAGFKDVQDRTREIATENADSTLAFAGKISNTNTFQEILSLQTQYVQDRMQAFAAQTQQLFSLIGETLQKWKSSATHAGVSSTPSNAAIAGFKIARFEDVQGRAVAIAKQNADSAFALIEKMAKAQNLQEALETKFAQEQMQAYAAQTQELQRLIGEALQGSARG
ncbi:MAG: phasin family protein [Rhodomicrobium sp.]